MLVGQLSDASAFSASVRGGPEFRSWTLANTLLAASVNLLHGANSQRAGKKSKPLIQPPRQKPKKRIMRVADFLAGRHKSS
jgi:hypothetical protein